MNQKNIALAYCIENKEAAEGIEDSLRQASYRFQHIYGKKTTSEPSLNEQLASNNNPILLLITDNFLKSAQCMNQSLDLIQSKGDQIIPVIGPGARRNPETGEMQKVQTNFERVSDIIQYINYWQDQYLELRRQKRHLKEELNEEDFNRHLKVMREISSEAGEFLRLLRSMDYITFEELQENHYQALFEMTNNMDAWDSYKKSAVLVSRESSGISSEKASQETIVTEKEEEEIPVDFGDIPGIDLIEGRETISKIIQNKQQEDEIEEEPFETVELPPLPGQKKNEDQLIEEKVSEEENTLHPAPSLEDKKVSDMPALPEEEEEEEEEEEDEEKDIETSIWNSLEEEEEDMYEEEDEDEEEYDDDDDDEDDEYEEEEEDEEEYLVDVEVRKILTEAMHLIDQGQFKDSLELLKEGIDQYPANNDLRYRYALLVAQDGSDIGEAIHQLEKILDSEPDNEDANFLMGELSEMKGDFGQARQYYEKVAAYNSEYLDVYYRLGTVLSNHYEDEYERAAKCFKKAAKKNPANVDALYQYALLLNEKLDKSKKAVKYLKRTLAEQGDHPFANYDLALVYHKLGKPEKAWESYQQAISLNPELRTPENDLVFALPSEEIEEEIVEIPAEIEKVSTSMPSEEEVLSSHTPPLPDQGEVIEMEQDTIEALKENIKRLEEIVMAKTAERTIVAKSQPVDLKTVFISGATSGIGKATAEVFASHGHRLILNGRRVARLEALKNQFESEYGIDILLVPFDIRDVNAIKEAIRQLPEEWRDIDVLLNNAGKAKGLSPIHEGQLEHWEEMIDTNVKGLLYLTRAIAPLMAERKSGHIINVSSTAGKEVYPNGNVYCATKFAVEALTKAMRLDLHKYNIRVSQVAPGHVEETEFALVRFDGDSEKAKIYEDFRPLTSKDVAEAIYFIASRPPHVNVQDILLMGTQQASNLILDRSGR